MIDVGLTFVPVGVLLDTKQFLPLQSLFMIGSTFLCTEALKLSVMGLTVVTKPSCRNMWSSSLACSGNYALLPGRCVSSDSNCLSTFG